MTKRKQKIKPFEECSIEEKKRRLNKARKSLEKFMKRKLTDEELEERERFARALSRVSFEDMFRPFTI